ncbi:hypothetical protein [Shimia sp. Alg240-R146]|uniref:hypothetical protein n=1 Tax=Shimia sp. Alg240-R146 TaxID=2993449 RepID=UPI0022E507B9|nr:hypothetical protein [Shimia sp. Alg240-R146]
MFKKTLFACAILSSAALADISEEANACIDEMRVRFGNVGGEILDQLGSEAGTLVRLRDKNGVVYECVVWSGPEVADLRRADGEEIPPVDVVSGTQRVQFDKGTSGSAMSATLKPNTTVRYILGASDGQFLNVDVASHGGALDYSIENPDGSMLLDLISSDRPYEGQLWQSGDHVIGVVNAGSQPVTFDIGIGIN